VSARLIVACIVCSWLLASCTFKDQRTHCRRDQDCGEDRCYDGFCVPRRTPTSPDMVSGGRGGRGGEGTGGAVSGSAAEGGMTAPDSGDMMTNRPDASIGGACEGDETRPCEALWEDAPVLGGCGRGTQTCVNGAWSSCTPERMMIGPESCNGIDDDCDGNTDEDSDEQCYPAGAAGCEQTEQKQFNCNGACRPGMKICGEDGSLGQCTGFIVAAATDNCSTEQIDENCDGTPNDNCQCNGNATRECYTGNAGTQGIGICRAGRQQCTNGRWGACQGAVVQRVEVCNGDDDDCDRNVDEVAGVGNRCTVPNARGVCAEGTFRCQAGNSAPQCVATSPQPMAETCNDRDDDCNGTADDVPAAQLETDPMHCGDCDTVCRMTDACCGGDCVDTDVDERNCGTCGRVCATNETCMAGICTRPPMDAGTGTMCDAMRPCAANLLCCNGNCVPNDVMNCVTCGTVCTGAVPACCATGCADLSRDNDNCGSCGTVCQNPDGGTACACATTGTPGVFECRNGSAACP